MTNYYCENKHDFRWAWVHGGSYRPKPELLIDPATTPSKCALCFRITENYIFIEDNRDVFYCCGKHSVKDIEIYIDKLYDRYLDSSWET